MLLLPLFSYANVTFPSFLHLLPASIRFLTTFSHLFFSFFLLLFLLHCQSLLIVFSFSIPFSSSFLFSLDDRLHVLVPVLVLQVVDELGAVDGVLGDLLAQVIEGDVRGEQLGGREVALVVADVAVVVGAQAEPGDGVEHKGTGLERDGEADVQVAVSDIVVEQAGASQAAHRAPQQAGGVDPDAKDQRGRDEACGEEEEKRGGDAREGKEQRIRKEV